MRLTGWLPTGFARSASVALSCLGLTLAGCGLFGGQTGDCSAEMGGSVPDTGPACGSVSVRSYDSRSEDGFTARDLIDVYGGTYTGTVDSASGSFWDAAGIEVPADPPPVSVTVTYRGGSVWETRCSGELEVEVEVELVVGEDLIARTSQTRLVGSLESASLDLALPPGDDESPELIGMALTVWPSGSARGSVSADIDGSTVAAALTLGR